MTRSPVLVLGMHRSGTSCLTGSLQQCGLYLGRVYESRPHNRKGNREHQAVMDVNNAVLAQSGGRWDQPPEALRWDDNARRDRDAVLDELAAGAGDAAWGFKDPRTLLTLPFWRERIPGPRFVATFRHPHRVARSLLARDPSMPMDAALALWTDHNQRLLELHAAAPFPVVCFDAAAQDYRRAIARVAGHLGLPGTDDDGGTPFFEAPLRTPLDAEAPPMAPAQAALYRALSDAAAPWMA